MSCRCDRFEHPARPSIRAGLDSIPERQLAGFPEYRRALLETVTGMHALRDWRAREGDDFGLMLLEWGAYIYDLLGFYDAAIAAESYLRTSLRRPSLRRLVGLIGYRPRPALAASVVLAAIAEKGSPVTLPPGTGFRSEAFDDEAPQVFETTADTVIDPIRNEWVLGPVRRPEWTEAIYLEPDSAALVRGSIAVLIWSAGSSPGPYAGRVVDREVTQALDGETYVSVSLDPDPGFPDTSLLEDFKVLSPSLQAFPTAFDLESGSAAVSTTVVHLDAVYKTLRRNQYVVVEHEDDLLVRKLSSVEVVNAIIVEGQNSDPDVLAPVTKITLDSGLPSGWTSPADALTIHFNLFDAGRLTRPAKTEIERDDFDPSGIDAADPADPPQAGDPDRLLMQDARDGGILAGGTVATSDDGLATVSLSSDTPAFESSLRTPVRVFGNLVEATRGESVVGEVLGSGDASLGSQSFTLKKSPLTYLNDPTGPDGRRSTLEVLVNGIRWTEVASFFGVTEEDQVYIVRQNDSGEDVVSFGGGARLPTGVDNVVASYRFGAGSAKPPAGSIRQLAKPFKGLRRVASPVAASGGADADSPDEIRSNAPASALLLGRAVSIPDFEAVAREFGVLNVKVGWEWDEAFQSAVVRVWFIPDGGDPTETAVLLRATLQGQTDPNTPITAQAATAVPGTLALDLEISDDYEEEAVCLSVIAALTDEESGMLAPANVPIGAPLIRSALFEAIMEVEGVTAVREWSLDGAAPGWFIPADDGEYRELHELLTVNGRAVSVGGTT